MNFGTVEINFSYAYLGNTKYLQSLKVHVCT